jgi:hypothetical protein
MKNAINSQFKMAPGSKEVDTVGTFKNDAAVLNMGHPTNYGTPIKKHEPGHGRKEGESKADYGKRVFAEAQERDKKRKEAAKKGTNKKSGRSGDFSFGPIKGNVKRYGEGG